MRSRVERFARRWWSGGLGHYGAALSLVGRPASWGWRASASVVGAWRAQRSERVPGVCVISVGNLAVGGTGKTPLTGWIAARLAQDGIPVAVLVGGAARDEAELHRMRLPGTTVLEGRDRVAGARRAAADGAAAVVLDDGFQHRRLARDLDIVLLAAEDRFPGPALPCGPYREGPGALSRADAIVVTRRTASAAEGKALASRADAFAPGRVVGGVCLHAVTWRRLGGAPSTPPGGDVVAACGVARPSAFVSAVALAVNGSVELVAFPDHHEYTADDVALIADRGMGRSLVITEKDAVKLGAHAEALGEAYVLGEELRWDWGEAAFLAELRARTRGRPS